MRLYIQNQIKNLALKGYGYKRIADILDDDLWLAAVDHITVYADETVTFTFKSGIEITEQM